jgi:hypothetical protein
MFAKIANDLGIGWHAGLDNDAAGINYKAVLEAHLAGATSAERISLLPHSNIELCLCEGGYGAVYLKHVPPGNVAKITAKPGDQQYWPEVLAALSNKFSKPRAALEVILEMEKKGPPGVPEAIKQILERALASAKRQP